MKLQEKVVLLPPTAWTNHAILHSAAQTHPAAIAAEELLGISHSVGICLCSYSQGAEGSSSTMQARADVAYLVIGEISFWDEDRIRTPISTATNLRLHDNEKRGDRDGTACGMRPIIVHLVTLQ